MEGRLRGDARRAGVHHGSVLPPQAQAAAPHRHARQPREPGQPLARPGAPLRGHDVRGGPGLQGGRLHRVPLRPDGQRGRRELRPPPRHPDGKGRADYLPDERHQVHRREHGGGPLAQGELHPCPVPRPVHPRHRHRMCHPQGHGLRRGLVAPDRPPLPALHLGAGQHSRRRLRLPSGPP